MKCSALVVLCFLATGVSADAPEIHKGHPRIYITAQQVPALRAKCRGPFRGVFEAMHKADWIMKKRPGTDWSDCTDISYPAFLFLVTGKKQYLDKTREFLDVLSARWPKDQYRTPAWLRVGSQAADWVWGGLTPAEREKYGRAFLDMADWVLKHVWRHSDFNNHFVNEHLAVLYVAVLLHGENIEPKRTARLLKVGTNYLLNHAVPAANEIAGELNRQQWSAAPRYINYLAQPPDPKQRGAYFVGGQAEGFSYNDWGYARPLALTCEMWRTATGQDLFKNSSFFRGQSVWHVYALRPDTGTFARSEDCSSGFKPAGNLKGMMHLLAGRLDDPLAEWLAERVPWKYVQRGWQEILWRNPKLRAKSPAELSLPLAACFPKLGHVYFRSSWGSKDAAFSLFQCGPFYAGHQHADNNTFVIHRSGSLAIDSGTNDYGSHRGNYYSRTIAHNGILVFDPRESFAGTPWNSPGTPGSNDGGQMRGKGVTRVGQWRPDSPGDAGRIVKFVNGKFVAACIGDATGSYRRQKVGRVVRAFYHLRGEAKNRTDTFVVFDRVETVRGKGPAKWIIHSIGKPAIDGDRFTITRAGGRLVGQVIWPEEVKFTLVGGPGRESFVNGRNYPPTGGKVDAEHGGWRIEFEFEKSAWVVLEAQAKGAALPPRVKAEGLDGSVSLRFRRGALQYDVKIGKLLHALPSVEVRRNGKVVERLHMGRYP